MSVPNYQSLMLPTLRAFKNKKSLKEAVEFVITDLGLSEEDRKVTIPSGKQPLIYNRVAWAKFYLSKAGLLISKERGVFELSVEGKLLLDTNPKKISNEDLEKYNSFRSFKSNNSVNTDEASDLNELTPDEIINKKYKEINNNLELELLERLRALDPYFFERIVLDVLIAMGYGISNKESAQVTQKSNDGGIDGIINEDTLGLDKIYLQAKRYKKDSSISRKEIQSFVGALAGEGATKGVFITTSNFSLQATEYAKNQNIVLIDGEYLAKLMIQYNVGTVVNRTIEFKKLDLTYFDESA